MILGFSQVALDGALLCYVVPKHCSLTFSLWGLINLNERIIYSSFDAGPEGPELEGSHIGIRHLYAASTPKETTPTAASRAANRGREAIANKPIQPEFTRIKAWGERNEEPQIKISLSSGKNIYPTPLEFIPLLVVVLLVLPVIRKPNLSLRLKFLPCKNVSVQQVSTSKVIPLVRVIGWYCTEWELAGSHDPPQELHF